MQDAERRRMWDARAMQGHTAGTDDRLARDLEVAALTRAMLPLAGRRVLDVGCGTGETLEHWRQYEPEELVGIDYSEGMIGEASSRPGLLIRRMDIRSLDLPPGYFDRIYTQRAIINLPTATDQQRAVRRLVRSLRPSGRLICCECSASGVARLNRWRRAIRLAPIRPPSHNRYLDDDIADAVPGMIPTVTRFAGLYYFGSRIVQARLAAWRGRRPRHAHWINRLTARRSPWPDIGQVQLWTWEVPPGVRVHRNDIARRDALRATGFAFSRSAGDPWEWWEWAPATPAPARSDPYRPPLGNLTE